MALPTHMFSGDKWSISNPNLRNFWAQDAIYRVLYGGRGSSKSWDAAIQAVLIADISKIRILCIRQFQNKISQSVYTLLKKQIYRLKLNDRYQINKASIINKFTGSEFLFYGIARNIEEIKSTEDVSIVWLEEAELLTKDQWEIIEPTFIRNPGIQFWIIFNPRLLTDFAYQYFVVNSPPKTIKRLINFDENPFLNQEMLDRIERMRIEAPDDYEHVYKGQPLADDDEAIIKRSWILAAIDAHRKLGIEITGAKRIGFDVADSGADLCAIVYQHGGCAMFGHQWKAKEDELYFSTRKVYDIAAVQKDIEVVYDSIGVGAGVGAMINQINESTQTRYPVRHKKFNAGAKVLWPDKRYIADIKNKDYFSNLKAQAWWLVADRFRATYNRIVRGLPCPDDMIISIDPGFPEINTLVDQLSIVKRSFDKAGKVQVETKEDLKERGISSPNYSDSFVCAYSPQPVQVVPGAGDIIWSKLAA